MLIERRTAIGLGLILSLAACKSQSLGGGSTGSGGSTSTSGSGGSGGSASTTGGGGASSTASGSGGGGGAGGSTSTTATTTSGAGGGVACAPAAQQVYAISDDGKLYAAPYDSATSWTVANLIGALACGGGGSPYSLAVDRSGTAWVSYTDGHLYKVDTATAACTPTAFATGQHGFTSFTLAFAADAPGADTETLYAAGSGVSGGSKSLATIDRGSFALTVIGDFDNPLVVSPVQLAGTGAGTLYAGTLHSAQYDLARIDPTSAHVIEVNDGASTLMHNLAPGKVYSAIPWGKYFWIFATEAGGTRHYFVDYQGEACSTPGMPPKLLPITAIAVGASTCATDNQNP